MDIDREIAAESRKQKAESRKQKAESRKQKAESRKQKILATTGLSVNGKLCCYCNYRKVFRVDVKIATTLMARDYKGFGGSSEYSNGVIEIECK